MDSGFSGLLSSRRVLRLGRRTVLAVRTYGRHLPPVDLSPVDGQFFLPVEDPGRIVAGAERVVILRAAGEEDIAVAKMLLSRAEDVIRREMILVLRIGDRHRMRNPIEGVLDRIVNRRVVDELVVPGEILHGEWITAALEDALGRRRAGIFRVVLKRAVVEIAPTAAADHEDLAGRQQDGVHGLHAEDAVDRRAVGIGDDGLPGAVLLRRWSG